MAKLIKSKVWRVVVVAACLLILFSLTGYYRSYKNSQSFMFKRLEDGKLDIDQDLNCPIAYDDLNGDGLKDWVIATCNYESGEKYAMRIFFAESDGSLREAIGIPEEAKLIYPIQGVVDDFNQDGLPDIIGYDQGDSTLGASPQGGFYGDTMVYLRSIGHEKWEIDRSLNQAYIKLEGTDKVHAKYMSAGDIDLNGYPDLWVESGGGHTGDGYFSPPPHFVMNYGKKGFEVDMSEERRSGGFTFGLDSRLAPDYVPGASMTGRWRHAANQIVDLNGDTYPDLLLGQLKNQNNGQNELDPLVVFNDKTGHFKSENAVKLPRTKFQKGYSSTLALTTVDLNLDEMPDIVITHTRSSGNESNDGKIWTGRYMQIIINHGDGKFEDVTDEWYMNEDIVTATKTTDGEWNNNFVLQIFAEDVNIDGYSDLVVFTNSSESTEPSRRAPLVYLNKAGSGLIEMDPINFTEMDFSRHSYWLPGINVAARGFSYLNLSPTNIDNRYGTKITPVVPR